MAHRKRSLESSNLQSGPQSPSAKRQKPSLLENPSAASTPSPTPDWPSRQKSKRCPHTSCTKSFDREAKLLEHLNSHTGARPFLCEAAPDCGKSFAQKRHLNRHVQSAHSDVRNYSCPKPGCGRAFQNGTRLRRHVETHVKKAVWRCTEYEGCVEEFRKHATLQRHVDEVHLGRKPYRCEVVEEEGTVCGKGFMRACCLRVHGKRFHSGLQYWCDLCTDGKPSLPTHDEGEQEAPEEEDNTEAVAQPSVPQSQDRQHGREQEHKHKATPLGFPTLQSYNTHLQLLHRPLCPFCPLTFASHQTLIHHLSSTHQDQYPSATPKPSIPCPHPSCARTYASQKTLTQHIARTHLQIRYTCGPTSLSASTLAVLAAFDSVRLGCGRSFSTRRSLEDHTLASHLGLPRRSKGSSTTAVPALEVSSASTPSSSGAETPRGIAGMLFPEKGGMSEARRLALEEGRTVFCDWQDGVGGARCEFAAKVPYHLGLHLRMGHGLGEEEVEEWMLEWEIGRAGGVDGAGRFAGFVGWGGGEGEEERKEVR